ncbi:MAG: M67 family metallopeptidase [Myxococcota bacterium]
MSERAPVGTIAVEADLDLEPLLVPRDRLLEVYEHARECYPEECCGILTGAFEGSFERGVRCTNLQNRRHATGESALDARQAFWIDEMELLQALREAEAREQRVVAVYHSHTDAGAYLSQADVSAALDADGLPLWPGVGHLVVSVQGGTVRSCAYFSWDEVRRSFIGRAVREGP